MSLLLYNGKFYGTDDAEWILIRNGVIADIGKGALPDATRKINLDGMFVYPGFCDSHTHLSNIALMQSNLDLSHKTKVEILEMIKNESRKKKIVIGRGWDESNWKDAKYITADEIDSVCADVPVVLVRECGHLATLNTAAMKKFGIVRENGLIFEDEVGYVLKNVERNLDIMAAIDYALSRGITAIHDFANTVIMRKYFELWRKNQLKIRVMLNFYRSGYHAVRKLGLVTGFGDEFFKIGGLKLFADGSIGAGTAATTYRDGKTVSPLMSLRQLRAYVTNANSRGIKVLTHAIGDLAIETVLRAYENTSGNRIEHFELATDEHIERIGESLVCMQPNFLKWAARGGLYEKMLGERWLPLNNAYRKILDAGHKLLFGSDGMPLSPLFGIHYAVNSPYEAQRISVDEALDAYTRGASHISSRLGKIKKGFLADLVVLDRDLKDRAHIIDAKVVYTIINGAILYSNISL